MTDRAEELRAARQLFERALAANTTPEEQRRREASARWAAVEQRYATRVARSADEEACPRSQWWQQ